MNRVEPKPGETWAPMLPWPVDECPEYFYAHPFAELGAGGKSGFSCVRYQSAMSRFLARFERVARELPDAS